MNSQNEGSQIPRLVYPVIYFLMVTNGSKGDKFLKHENKVALEHSGLLFTIFLSFFF